VKPPARFHRLADREFTEAAEYFERESQGLGAAFIDAVEACVAEIVAFPEAGATVSGGVRRRMVRRFPYSVLYTIRPDHIRILAVMHAKRRPMYWIDRA
jgi:plasmid stabilization system protein ParE